MSTVLSSAGRETALSVESILAPLTAHQHLHPHWHLGQALKALTGAKGLPTQAVAAAVQRLNLDQTRLIGRLRRTELSQLAQCIYRRVEAVEAGDHGR